MLRAAIDVAHVLQKTVRATRGRRSSSRRRLIVRTLPRLGNGGPRTLRTLQIHAVRGETDQALRQLARSEQAGWRRGWRYYRDFDPNLASIRNEPEFKAVFADIERDMAQQRARLAARPKDAPLELSAITNH